MSVGNTLYNTIFKRSSTFALAVVGSVFFFERTFDLGSGLLFDKLNEGVSYVMLNLNKLLVLKNRN